MDTETRRILATAKGLVAGGWCQFKAARGSRVCAMGAVNQALVGDPFFQKYDKADFWARERVQTALERAASVDSGTLAKWNDAPGRTQAEVVALFDKALTEEVPVVAHRLEAVTG